MKKIWLIQTATNFFDNEKLIFEPMWATKTKSEAIKDYHNLKSDEYKNREADRKKFGKVLYERYYKISLIQMY